MNYISYVLFLKITSIYALTCNEILNLPPDKKLSLSELQSIQPKDIIDCLAFLGKEEMAKPEAEFIWHSLIRFYNGISNIPENILEILHWVTPAVTPTEYSNMTLSNIDVIQNFGLNYNLDMDQLSAIADRVREDFAGKEPEDFTYYDLSSLRQILCAFNRSEIERIHPSAYRDAARIIGKLENCNPEVMMGFASLAVQETAFGLPSKWTEVVKQALGKVVDFLPQDYNSHKRSST